MAYKKISDIIASENSINYYPNKGNEFYSNLTDVIFEFNFTNGETYNSFLDVKYDIIWKFGDGDSSTELYPSHVYQNEGKYIIEVIIKDIENNETFYGKTSINVKNFIKNSIKPYNNQSSSQTTYQNHATTKLQVEFFYNTTTDIIPTIWFYAKGSNSSPLLEEYTDKWAHLYPRWYFLDGDYQHIFEKYVPSSIEDIKVIFDDDVDDYIISESSDAKKIGIKGVVDFYYVDDSPSNRIYSNISKNYDTVELIITLQSKYLKTDEDLYEAPNYINSLVYTTYNIEVMEADIAGLSLTSNGLDGFVFEEVKYNNIEYPMVISLVDSNNDIVKQYNESLSGDSMELDIEITGLNSTDYSLSSTYPYTIENGYFKSSITFNTEQDTDNVIISLSAYNTNEILTYTSSPFSIKTQIPNLDIQKINEDFKLSDTLRGYALQDKMFKLNYFWEVFLPNVFGESGRIYKDLGISIYQRISNFVSNNTDVELCNVNSLYSIAQMVGIENEIDDYRFNYPDGLNRLIDLLSISQSNLLGAFLKSEDEFLSRCGSYAGKNLGSQIDLVDVPFNPEEIYVFRKHGSENMFKVTMPDLNEGFTYSAELLATVGFVSPVIENYTVFEYVESDDEEGEHDLSVIDWKSEITNSNNSLSYNMTAEEWDKTSGFIDQMFINYLQYILFSNGK